MRVSTDTAQPRFKLVPLCAPAASEGGCGKMFNKGPDVNTSRIKCRNCGYYSFINSSPLLHRSLSLFVLIVGPTITDGRDGHNQCLII